MQLTRHFLIAMPRQTGSYFANTVTYVCEHNKDGAMGLMINRPLDLSVERLMKQFGYTGAPGLADAKVLEGGPVSPEQGFVVHSDDGNFAASRKLGNGLMLTASREVLEAIANGQGPYHYLIALGYAGWGPKQLERELAESAWLTCPANNSILFDVPFEDRFEEATRALGIDFRLMSNQTGDA